MKERLFILAWSIVRPVLLSAAKGLRDKWAAELKNGKEQPK